MSIVKTFEKFYKENYKILSHEYYDSDGVDIPSELVTPNNTKLDSMGNEIQPGDLVACHRVGGGSTSSNVAILLGFTPNGYRVVPFYTSPIAENRILCSHMISPPVVFLVKSKSSPIV